MTDKGRPTAYDASYAEQASKICEMFGATDLDLAQYFGVCERTIYNWKHDHEDFLHALKSKKHADSRVERALYERAIGYSHPEDKILSNPQDPENPIITETIKHYAPDTGACVVWLANRQPDKWKKDPGGEKSSDNLADSLAALADKLPD